MAKLLTIYMRAPRGFWRKLALSYVRAAFVFAALLQNTFENFCHVVD